MARNDDLFNPEREGLALERGPASVRRSSAGARSRFADDISSVTDTEIDLAELEAEDAALDSADEEEEKFLRAPRRVPVRKSAITRKTANRLRWVLLGLLIVGLASGIAFAVDRYTTHSWRFRFESSDHIETAGLSKVTRAQIMEVMGADIGRNLFRVDLAERKRQLEEIPWVESATVMRLLPDRLRIQVTERKPAAFVRIGSKISLIDAGGVIMDLPARQQSEYSFPVITGMADSEPLSTRAARMRIYSRMVADLDAGNADYSKDLSEVDLSDPDNVKVTVEDPKGALVVHLGAESFQDRYRIYIRHIQEWRQQFQKLESVDLRYNGQIIVNPEARATASVAAAPPPKKK